MPPSARIEKETDDLEHPSLLLDVAASKLKSSRQNLDSQTLKNLKQMEQVFGDGSA